MNRRDLLAYALVVLGVLALLARMTGGAGWIWIALVAAALLAGYAQQRTYGFLVLGGVLAGTAIGLLLQGAFPRLDGIFLIALGAGLVAVDRVEPRDPRWARGVGLALVGLGLVLALLNADLLTSAPFAVLLIAVGALLLWRRRTAAAFPPPLVRTGTPAVPPVPSPLTAPTGADAAPTGADAAPAGADAAPAASEAAPAASAPDAEDASAASPPAHDATEPHPGTG